MKHLLTILAAFCILAAPAAAQTMRALMFSTNGQVVANTGTNFLMFTNNIWLSQIGATFKLDDAITIESEGETYIDSFFNFNREIRFNPTNSAAATTRTNLGLGLPLLTSTSITNFQAALFSTNTAPTNTTNVSAWTTIQIGTNAFRVPLYK